MRVFASLTTRTIGLIDARQTKPDAHFESQALFHSLSMEEDNKFLIMGSLMRNNQLGAFYMPLQSQKSNTKIIIIIISSSPYE